MSGEKLPEPIPPWWVLAAWWVCGWVTWPWQVRQLKREGYRRTGWGTWESP